MAHLDVRASNDGTWLEFRASDGKSALLRIETIADKLGPLVGAALSRWCEDRQAEREKPHTHRSKDGKSDLCVKCGHDIRHEVHWAGEKCERCNGTGVIDAPYSGSDPSCPECSGEGWIWP